MQRIEINVVTGDQRVVPLTTQEIAAAESRTAKEQSDVTYRDQRKAAYLAELGGARGDFVETVGDVLDDLIREVRALAAGPVTPEFAHLVSRVDAIKARFPKS